MRRTVPLGVCILTVCLLALLAGCTLPGAEHEFDGSDEIGYVAGYNATDSLDVDASDGLTEAELQAVTYRSMARIEVLRGLAFQEDVTVETVDRETLRERYGAGGESADTFTNEVWQAAFVVDGETDVNDELDALYGESVQGYYTSDTVVIVADDSDGIHLDRTTFVHELVHALQDQHFGIASTTESIDAQLANQGLVEGEAEYLPVLYDERCETDWECVGSSDPISSTIQPESVNLGLLLSLYAPYASGGEFVAHLDERGGWDAVDAAYDDRPVSTSQVIDPERYPDDLPRDLVVEDRSTDAWEPITDEDGEPRTETVGEATLFATLFANGVIDRPIDQGATELSRFNYSHPTTDGWAGDQLVVYEERDDESGEDGGTDEPRTGHVWTLAWESDADAGRFHDAYLELLEHHGAEPVEDAEGTYRIPDGESYGGAYVVTLDGDEVQIVGGPDVDALGEIDTTPPAVATASTTVARPLPGVESSAPASPGGGTSPVVPGAVTSSSVPETIAPGAPRPSTTP